MKTLITGAAGSIGSELCRQLSKDNEVIALDQDESGLFDLEGVIPEICNIRDYKRLEWIFKKYKPVRVFHAAAYKHLSKHEKEHCSELIETNIKGTLNLIMLSKLYDVSNFIFISTDKAVNPTSLMGATKLIGEIITKRNDYVVVRFGNVIGSRGSVIPIWKKQVKEGKPITITDLGMERYFMTIKEACELVIMASEIGEDGQIITLDMGEQRLIVDVAKEMFGDHEIQIIGKRQGEKLEEELMTKEEKQRSIKDGKFNIISK